MTKLNENFLLELAKCCITSSDFIEIITPHLKYSFLPSEEYKELFKFIFDYHSINGKSPTVGVMSQKFVNSEVLHLIKKVKDIYIGDKRKEILEVFEEYIKKSMFIELFKKTQSTYNEGSHDKAISQASEGFQKINEFNLRSKVYSRVFRDFDKRQRERKNRDFSKVKIPTGIPAFDFHTKGGIELGTSLLVTARSGVGKSTILRWFGYYAAFMGFNVVHFQAEGKAEEVYDLYDSMWTTVPINQIKTGEISVTVSKKIAKSQKDFMAHAGEIYVIAFEQFDTASILDCRSELIDIMKLDDISLAIFDYLEEFDPGDGKRYSTSTDGVKSRKKAVSKKIVNIATEFNIVTATATQANDIPLKDWNNPDFVITRNNISNDKEAIQPFAYHLTLNQTMDEYDNRVIRLFEDKNRHFRVNSNDRVYKVKQKDGRTGKFIDLEATKELFWDDRMKRPL